MPSESRYDLSIDYGPTRALLPEEVPSWVRPYWHFIKYNSRIGSRTLSLKVAKGGVPARVPCDPHRPEHGSVTRLWEIWISKRVRGALYDGKDYRPSLGAQVLFRCVAICELWQDHWFFAWRWSHNRDYWERRIIDRGAKLHELWRNLHPRSRRPDEQELEVSNQMAAAGLEITKQTISSNPFPQFRGRVLVMDDDEMTRESVVHMLEYAGISDVVAVDCPADAIEALRTKPVDLALFDQELGKNVPTGSETARTLRDMGYEIPIVLVSGHTRGVELEEAGMDDWLQKPWTPQAFLDVLRRWLPPAGP